MAEVWSIIIMTPTNLKFMLGWALATFVKGMKIRLRKNWLSILAKREVPQSRNCLWCDELMINYDRYGLCCVWRGYVIKSVFMSEHALYFVIRRGVWGGRGRGFFLSFLASWFFVFFWLVSSVTYGYDDNTPTHSRGQGGGGQVPPYDFLFCFFLVVSSAVGHGHDSTPTPLLIVEFGQGLAQYSARHFARIVWGGKCPLWFSFLVVFCC